MLLSSRLTFSSFRLLSESSIKRPTGLSCSTAATRSAPRPSRQLTRPIPVTAPIATRKRSTQSTSRPRFRTSESSPGCSPSSPSPTTSSVARPAMTPSSTSASSGTWSPSCRWSPSSASESSCRSTFRVKHLLLLSYQLMPQMKKFI